MKKIIRFGLALAVICCIVQSEKLVYASVSTGTETEVGFIDGPDIPKNPKPNPTLDAKPDPVPVKLPQTGRGNSISTSLAGGFIVGGLLVFKKRQKRTDE